MREERHWVAVVSEDTYASERLYAFESLVLAGSDGAGGEVARPGDLVALVAASDPFVLFGLGRMRAALDDSKLRIRYTHRLFDEPVPVPGLRLGSGLHPVSQEEYARLAGGVSANRRTDADKSEWFVSVALPIEAPSPAEAVREFWTFVDKLGPRELPAFVWPRGDELAMLAYVLGDETNLDPEEDD